MFAIVVPVRLSVSSLDRLVELVEDYGGLVAASDAVRVLFAAADVPEGLAHQLLRPLVETDSRLGWRGSQVTLAASADPLIADASFVVFDLETTGLARPSSRICEIGAVRIERLAIGASFQTFVEPDCPVTRSSERVTGITNADLSGAPRIGQALPRFVAFARTSVLVAHNARFDVGFIDRELDRQCGKRLAATVIDTMPLARNLLPGRVERTSLAALAVFFGVSVEPCHRALPDAQATAEVFLRLIELAREQGATTIAELQELAATRPRRIQAKRHLVRDAPTCPGVYLFRDHAGQVLYVGKARNLRNRLRSYFHNREQRPAVEEALDGLERIEWRITGSELAASLEEIRLIRELRPAANKRTPRPENYVYLHRKGPRVVVSRAPSRFGPLRHRAQARRAAEALKGCSEAEFDDLLDGAALERLRHELPELAERAHELELRRQRRRISSLQAVIGALDHLQELLVLELCVLAPSLEPGQLDVFVVGAGRVEHRGQCEANLSPAEVRRSLSHSFRPATAIEADQLDALLTAASVLKDPASGLCVMPLALGARHG